MDRAAIEDFFAPVGAVRVKRMFGGQGVYLDEAIFAIEMGGEFYLKADETTAPQFQAAGSEPFAVRMRGRATPTSYWSLPDAALDDAEELARWCALALAAARRKISAGAAAKRRKKVSRLA